METLRTTLPTDIQAAVTCHHGGPVAVSGQLGEHVVVTMAVFRDMMGVGSDEEHAKSVESLKISLAQAAAGQTMSLEEAAEKLDVEIAQRERLMASLLKATAHFRVGNRPTREEPH